MEIIQHVQDVLLSAACNYDPSAIFNDGSCEFISCLGCTNQNACNFNSEAVYEDGSCIYAESGLDCDGVCINDTLDGVCNELEVAGCTDTTACNFSADATDLDDSCEYAEQYYDCDGNCLADADLDGICDGDEIAGCTDPAACNYNASATDDNGSCEWESCCNINFEYIVSNDTGNCDGYLIATGFSGGISGSFATNTGFVWEEIPIENQSYTEFCAGEHEIYIYDSVYPNCSTYLSFIIEGPINGCTDESASNYNEFATDDDGSCCYDEWVQIGSNINGITEYERFGRTTSLSDDGNIIAIGGHSGYANNGVVRVYSENGNGDGFKWDKI